MFRRLLNASLWLMNWRTKRFWVLIVFTGLPTAHVLSLGPVEWAYAMWLWQWDYSRVDPWLNTAYWPLDAACDSSDVVASILDPYVEFWLDLADP